MEKSSEVKAPLRRTNRRGELGSRRNLGRFGTRNRISSGSGRANSPRFSSQAAGRCSRTERSRGGGDRIERETIIRVSSGFFPPVFESRASARGEEKNAAPAYKTPGRVRTPTEILNDFGFGLRPFPDRGRRIRRGIRASASRWRRRCRRRLPCRGRT